MNLLNLELMSATEKVHEALLLRGLFMEIDRGSLVFSKCNAKYDMLDVKHVLNDVNIPFLAQDNLLEILVNYIPIAKMKKTITAGGHPFSIDYMPKSILSTLLTIKPKKPCLYLRKNVNW